MPQLDMAIDELKAYTGCTPCPGDFDAYWDRALAELDAVDANVELVPSAFQSPAAQCFDLYFTGVRGARIHAKYLRPRVCEKKSPAVLQFHGYSCNAGDWLDKIPYPASGLHLAALDCRGQGGWSEDTGGVKGTTLHGHIIRGLDDAPDKLLFRDIFLDTVQLARIVMDFPDVDETRVGAFGGSQGGGLTLACAALEPRVNRAAPLYPFLCDYRRVWDMDLCKLAYQEIRDYFRLFDPQHKREDAVFTMLGYIDVAHLASRIRGKVQMTTGLMDEICPPSTQFAAYNNLTSQKEMLIYPDFGHEHIPDYADRTYQFMLEMLERETALG